MIKIEIHKNDITNLKTEAIVNAANTHLAYGGGVCGAIFDAAGKDLLENAIGINAHCNVGEAVITPAFNLKNNKYIIHAVGPDCRKVQEGKEKLLYNAYTNTLKIAMDKHIKSIGFPLLSAGIFKYPEREAWEVALTACRDFLRENYDYQVDIVFVRRHRSEVELGKEVLAEIELNNPIDWPMEILKSVDSKKLASGIAYLKNVKEIKWGGGPTDELGSNGKPIWQFPYPIYDDEVYEILSILKPDSEYYPKYQDIQNSKIVPSEMSIEQIRVCMFALIRGERFCDGFIESHILDNTLLKYLLRIEDLLAKNGLLNDK